MNSIEQDGGANADETFVNCAEVKVGGEHVAVPGPKQGTHPRAMKTIVVTTRRNAEIERHTFGGAGRVWEEGPVWEGGPVEHIEIDLTESFDPDNLNRDDWHDVFGVRAIIMDDKAGRIAHCAGASSIDDMAACLEAATFIRGLAKEMLDRCHRPFSRVTDVMAVVHSEGLRRFFAWTCDEWGSDRLQVEPWSRPVLLVLRDGGGSEGQSPLGYEPLQIQQSPLP